MKITSKAVADGESFGKSCEQMPVCYYVNVWFLQGLHAFRINSKGDCQQSQGRHAKLVLLIRILLLIKQAKLGTGESFLEIQ